MMEEEPIPRFELFEEERVYPPSPPRHTDSADAEFHSFLIFNTQGIDNRCEYMLYSHGHDSSSDGDSRDNGRGGKRSRSRDREAGVQCSGVTGEDLSKLFTPVDPPRPPPISKKTPPKPPSKPRSANTDGVSCMCMKTKCIKMYCICFSRGMACGGECSCKECNNTPAHVMTRTEEKRIPPIDTPGGCNCKMSYCEKSYCSCARDKEGCTALCTCYNCKNPHGSRKKK